MKIVSFLKKYYYVFAALTILIGVGVVFLSSSQRKINPNAVPYTLEGKKMYLLVADTQEEREKGLMHLRSIPDADGMIFIFENKDFRSFWNMNTLMDLDVYWIDEKKVVGKGFLPSIEKSKQIVTTDSPVPVNIVIEIPR